MVSEDRRFLSRFVVVIVLILTVEWCIGQEKQKLLASEIECVDSYHV